MKRIKSFKLFEDLFADENISALKKKIIVSLEDEGLFHFYNQNFKITNDEIRIIGWIPKEVGKGIRKKITWDRTFYEELFYEGGYPADFDDWEYKSEFPHSKSDSEGRIYYDLESMSKVQTSLTEDLIGKIDLIRDHLKEQFKVETELRDVILVKGSTSFEIYLKIIEDFDRRFAG